MGHSTFALIQSFDNNFSGSTQHSTQQAFNFLSVRPFPDLPANQSETPRTAMCSSQPGTARLSQAYHQPNIAVLWSNHDAK